MTCWELDKFLDQDLTEEVKKALVIEAPRVTAARKPDMNVFSKSDLDCLAGSLRVFGHMSFGMLKRMTHEEQAYCDAPANGEMDYLKMIDQENPHRDRIIQHLQETAKHLSL